LSDEGKGLSSNDRQAI